MHVVGVLSAERVRQRRQVDDVADKPLAEIADDRRGRANEEDEEQQQRRNRHVDLAEHLHAAIEAADHGHQRDGGDADDQDDLHCEIVRNAEHMLETRICLLRADAERGCQAE